MLFGHLELIGVAVAVEVNTIQNFSKYPKPYLMLVIQKLDCFLGWPSEC